MTVKLKTGTSTWSTIKKAWAKTGTSTWSPAKAIFAKLSTGWQKIWPGNAPSVDEDDPINIRLTSYSGAVALSPQYINTKLYGNDGSYTGAQPVVISGRKMRVASDDTGNTTRYVVESSDIFDMSTATATDRYYVDGWYLFYELLAENVDGYLDAFSPPIKIIKRIPQFSGVSLTGTVGIGQQLTFNFTAQNFYYNSPDYSRSYVRWWRNTSKTPGGTILKTDYLTDVTRVGTAWGDGYANTPTSITGYSTYNVESPDTETSTYVVAELVLINSYHDHNGGSTGTYVSSGGKPIVGSLSFLDNNGRDGTDNQSRYPYYSPRIPVATSLSVNASISNAAANTAYVIKYRIYNNETGVYWKPFDEVTATSGSSAWQSYTPSSSFSGETATITDYFNISSTTFNGSTYNDGISSAMPRWQLEIQVSATTPGFSASYNNPPFNFEVFALSPGVVPTISASPSSGGIPLAVTFTGSFTGFPLGSSYPRAYRINYGDGNYSGWQTFSTNSANPSYSNSYTYTTTGSYSPLIEVQPATTSASTSVTPISVPDAPTSLTATTTRSDGVLLNWNAVSGANYYEIYWGSILGAGPVNQSSFADFGQDNIITTNSFLDTTLAVGATRYYRVRARSAASSSGTNCSNWFPAQASNGVAGTRVAITPSIPTWISGVANGTSASSQTITLSWNAATNANNYELYFNGTGTTPGGTTSPDYGVSTIITATTFTTQAIFSANTDYYWWVRSVSTTSTRSGWSLVRLVTTNSNFLTAPIISSVTPGNTGGPVSVAFTGGSGPYFQAYWTGSTAPTTAVTPDASGPPLPLTDTTGPSSTTTVYMYVRSTATIGETSVGPSALASAWSSGVAFNMTQPVPGNTGAPTLTGTTQVGQTVTFTVGSWSNTPTSYSLRLYRGTAGVLTSETLVKDAGNVTSSTYVIQAADSGYYLRAFATATNAGGTSNGGTYTPGVEIGPITTPVAPPVNTAAPTITGSGRSFSVSSNGTWSPSDADGVYGYQWKYNDQGSLYLNIPGQTSSTLNLSTATYDGIGIRCYVTATNAGGSVTANSNTLTPSAPVAVPTNATAPTLTPTSISVGTLLTAGRGTWNNAPTSYDVRIYRGTANVATSETLVASGTGTSVTYTVTQADYDSGSRYFRTFVNATNAGGSSGFIGGQERGPIATPVSIPSGGSVTLTGTASVGQTLSASTSGWSGSPTSYDIRIVRGTAGVIIGETLKASSTTSAVSYVVQSADVGYYFKAFAAATNAAGTSGFVSSTEKGPVPSSGVVPSAPSVATTSYTSGPSWTGSWAASTTGTATITYYWSFYVASDSSGTNATFVNSGSTTGTTMPAQGNGGTGFVWGRVQVYASNAYGSSTTTYGNWA